MGSPSVEQVFDGAYSFANNAILTVSEVPEGEEQLLKLLERVLMRGRDNQANLTSIHLPMERFPFMDSKFWHVPVEDCGSSQVLRFFFETPDPLAH